MADKFFEEEEQKAQEEIEKIKLGENEYDPKELESIIEKGKKYDEFSKKYNTDPDKAWSAYGKTTTENKAIKEELETLRHQTEVKQQTQTGDLTDEQIQQAREQARKLGIMTQGDMDSWYQSRRSAERLLEKCSSYEGEINGEDGRPKFVTEEILKHMEETGIKDPQKAYKDKYEPELDAWKESVLSKERGNTMSTLSTQSNKMPTVPKITKDNLADLVREQLNFNRGNE